MEILEMTQTECLQTLESSRLAHLACAHENQPYIVPTYLAFYAPLNDAPCLYGFTTPGLKVEWMRANPLVCVEVEDVKSYDQWTSVIVLGHYEELAPPQEKSIERFPERRELPLDSSAHTTNRDDELKIAHRVLQAKGIWWEPGSSAWVERNKREKPNPFTLIYYKLRIEKITGHRAFLETQAALSKETINVSAVQPGWLQTVKKWCGYSAT